MLRDGKWVPTFANASYVFQQIEYDRWGKNRAQYPAPAYNDGIFERSVQPVVEAGLARLVHGRASLAEGVAVEHAPGHTAGHQILHLESAGQRACFTGDCFHHPIQLVEPSIPFGDAESLDEVIAIRKRLGVLAADQDVTLIPAHLPYPHAVKGWYDGESIRFAAAISPSGA